MSCDILSFKCFYDCHLFWILAYWRALDFDFEGQVLSHVLDLRDEEGWNLSEVPIQNCVNTLQDLYEK